MPTIDEYNVAKQSGRIIHTKIFLLNFKLQRVEELSGIVLDGASFTIDANSDIRRTCSISLIPTTSSFNIEEGSNIWIDKYIQIYIGIEDTTNNNEIVYTNMGYYLINNPSETYNATNHTLTLNGIDMMAKLTGLRNGNLVGAVYQAKAGELITDVMKDALELSNVTKYNLEKIIPNPSTLDDEVPTPTPFLQNDMSISIGGTTYDIISQLRDINMNYQTYFDIDGTFWFNKIPSGHNEPIMVTDDIWKSVLIDYSTDVSFENVKNSIEVFGKTQEDGTTPYGFIEETNEDSPYYINGTAGKIRLVCIGGEYDNIFSDELAQDRAEYELYLHCRLQDQISITCVPIYWLDVNWLIELTLPNKQGKDKTNQYIIKSINTTLGINGTQKITLMKYYPLYEDFDI